LYIILYFSKIRRYDCDKKELPDFCVNIYSEGSVVENKLVNDIAKTLLLKVTLRVDRIIHPVWMPKIFTSRLFPDPVFPQASAALSTAIGFSKTDGYSSTLTSATDTTVSVKIPFSRGGFSVVPSALSFVDPSISRSPCGFQSVRVFVSDFRLDEKLTALMQLASDWHSRFDDDTTPAGIKSFVGRNFSVGCKTSPEEFSVSPDCREGVYVQLDGKDSAHPGGIAGAGVLSTEDTSSVEIWRGESSAARASSSQIEFSITKSKIMDKLLDCLIENIGSGAGEDVYGNVTVDFNVTRYSIGVA